MPGIIQDITYKMCLIPPKPAEVGPVIIPMLQMEKPEAQDIVSLAQDHKEVL